MSFESSFESRRTLNVTDFTCGEEHSLTTLSQGVTDFYAGRGIH